MVNDRVGINYAIDNYISFPKKVARYSIVCYHRHGNAGLQRAELLKHYVSILPDSALECFISKYMHKSISGDYLCKVIDLYRNRRSEVDRILYDKFGVISKDQHDKNAKILNSGNNHTSSLRTYVRNAFDATKNAGKVNFDYFRLSNKRSDLDIEIDKESFCRSDSLGSGSAHPVTKYVAKNRSVYFGKDINGDDEKDIYFGEIFISLIWRWAIGERASGSYLMIKNGKVAGICSKALPGFTEYKDIHEETRSKYSGLLSIMLISYIMMEDDLHVKNIGVMVNSKKQSVYGKIDHDYTASKWDKKQGYFENQFDCTHMATYLETNSMKDFHTLMNKFRFSPGTQNNAFLRAGHYGRNVVGLGPHTTVNGFSFNNFYSDYMNVHGIDMGHFYTRLCEMNPGDILELAAGLRKRWAGSHRIGSSMRHPLTSSAKMESLVQKLYNRFQSVQKEVSTYYSSRERFRNLASRRPQR